MQFDYLMNDIPIKELITLQKHCAKLSKQQANKMRAK